MTTINQYIQALNEYNRLEQEENYIQVTKKPKVSNRNVPRFYFRASTMNSRARRLNIEGTVTIEDLEFVFNKFGGKCIICSSTSDICFDHIISFYRGGNNTRDNLQLSCHRCNMEKGVN